MNIPAGLPPAPQFRIDLSDQPGLARLSGMRLLGDAGNTIWEWDGVSDTLQTAIKYDMEMLSLPDSTGVLVHLQTHDPRLLLPIPEGALDSLGLGGSFEVDLSWIGTIVPA